ncbi:hypothetical protein F5Y11DRAFT_315426 [Daldinia sp. FL1419]|nr:hypothetical protein F5Y11DRAFT_315426 [Daldinia sp. FL1419]
MISAVKTLFHLIFCLLQYRDSSTIPPSFYYRESLASLGYLTCGYRYAFIPPSLLGGFLGIHIKLNDDVSESLGLGTF